MDWTLFVFFFFFFSSRESRGKNIALPAHDILIDHWLRINI